MIEWYYLVLIASALIGFATIIEKRTLRKEYASAYSASFSVLIAAISLAFLPFIKVDISVENWIIIYLISLLSTVTYIMTARIYKHGTLSATSPLSSTLPILFVVLFAFLFLNEVLTPIQYIGIGITILASYLLLFQKTKRPDFESSKYKYLILISAMISGLASILFKYVLDSTNPIAYLVIMQVFVAVNMTVYMNFKYGGLREILANAKVYKIELGAIVLLTLGYRIAYYEAVAVAPISLASPLSNVFLIIMSVFSGSVIFKEGNLQSKILLSVLMLLGAFLMIL